MEVEIRPRTFSLVLIVSTIAVLTLLGYQASPRDETGRPVLLLPDVRAVELYRRSAVRWTGQWQEIGASLAEVLTEDGQQLLPRSREAQRAFDRAVALALQVDGTEAPSALLGLHEQAMANSDAHIQASAAVARWLSAPTEENRVAAEAALEAADTAQAAFASNEWVAPTIATETP
jgi:hypothetical protein